jgi:hypothetical protein
MTLHIERRAFLALGVGALAWACARGGDDDGAQDTAQPTGPAGVVNVLAGAPVMAIGDTRQPIVILRGQRPIAPDDLKVELAGPGVEPFEVTATKHEIVRGLGGEEIEEGHTHAPGTEVEEIFVIRHDFDREGAWDVSVSFDGGRGAAAFQVVKNVPSPKVGEKAIASDSPTTDDPKGVDPICTRDPVCSMHDVTVADALARNRPLVITFATPRFCTSRACGPVVDIVEAEKERVGDEASFVHVEVWKDDSDSVGQTPAPTFGEWKFDGEPWTYFIGADGTVKDRWLGPVGADELTKAVDALIAGKL